MNLLFFKQCLLDFMLKLNLFVILCLGIEYCISHILTIKCLDLWNHNKSLLFNLGICQNFRYFEMFMCAENDVLLSFLTYLPTS